MNPSEKDQKDTILTRQNEQKRQKNVSSER